MLAILDALPDVVAAFDLDGRLELINEPGARFFGIVQTEREPVLLSDLYTEGDAERIVAEALPHAFEQGHWIGNAALRGAGGRFFECEQHWIAQRDGSGKASGLVLVARSFETKGAQKADPAEVELRNRKEILAFLSTGIVHDLNNLLGPIQTYSELAEQHMPVDSGVHRYFERIHRASEGVQRLTERLATLGRHRVIEYDRLDLSVPIREIAGWLRVARPDLTIAVELPQTGAEVHGDVVQLHQVIANLGRNAVEALPDRTGTVRLTLSSTDLGQLPALRLAIGDDGVGIETPHRASIFEPFFTTKSGHAGLGLTVSRHIVEAHGGRLVAEHPAEGGTVITVDLPASRTD